MLLLKFLQTLIKALNSKGGPGEIALGMAIGMAFGLTPLMSLHNIVVLAIAMLTTVSFPGVMLGWAVAIPLGFALDPVFHSIGMALLTNESLTPLFVWIVNTPIISLGRFNNSIVLGSLVFWLVSIVPAFFLFRWLVARYRADVYARLQKVKFFQAIKASKLWQVYETFRP
ncbi:MAG TPA: TIGR03546 family protein [Gemmatimonadaceae bacterium]|nr:TIGR03546 family protein [Gemmatimonadaceae bacterium]